MDINDLTYDQICHLPYENLLILMDSLSDIDDLCLLLEALTVKYYPIHPDEVWSRVEEYLQHEDEHARFTAVASLSFCIKHQDIAIELAKDIAIHDQDPSTKLAARAFVESFIK